MRGQSSATVSGGQCRKHRRWCRELKWGSIFCGRAGVAAAAMSRANSRKKNFLFSEVRFFPLSLFSLKLKNLEPKTEMPNRSASAEPAAAEDEVAFVENGSLAWRNGALRRVERDLRRGGVERHDGSGRGLVLVADFGERAKLGGGVFAGNPIHACDLACRLSEDIVFADHDAIFLRIDRENVKRLAGGEAEALALADRKIVNAVVAANHVAVLADDFAFSILQRNSALS